MEEYQKFEIRNATIFNTYINLNMENTAWSTLKKPSFSYTIPHCNFISKLTNLQEISGNKAVQIKEQV